MANLHLVNFRDGTCNDLHVITEAEWSDFPPLRLNIMDTAPAVCNFPSYDLERVVTHRAGKCEKEFDPIPF